MKKIREIVQLGHPVLRLHAQQVEQINSKSVVSIANDMLYTLAETNGVGLAAPQINESLRIIIIASRPSKRYPSAPEMEPMVMYNPQFEVLSKQKHKDWEGCLSIPGIRALVPRYEKIKISYYDGEENKQTLVVDGFIARVFQHEYDHLNGLLYLDRVENNRDIISEAEFQKIMQQNHVPG